MSEQIDVTELGPREYGVRLTEGQDTTHHKVTVTAQLLDDLLLDEEDGARLVQEAMAFLLERDTADSVPDELSLGQLVAEHEDFLPEMRDRLG